MLWLDNIKEVTGLRLEVLKKKQYRLGGEKRHTLVEEKTRIRESTNVK